MLRLSFSAEGRIRALQSSVTCEMPHTSRVWNPGLGQAAINAPDHGLVSPFSSSLRCICWDTLVVFEL